MLKGQSMSIILHMKVYDLHMQKIAIKPIKEQKQIYSKQKFYW